MSAPRHVADAIRAEGARILSTLVRVVGDLQIAEDAMQENAIRALQQWPVNGIPDSPRAWLTVTARRAAIDALRREHARSTKERTSVKLDVAALARVVAIAEKTGAETGLAALEAVTVTGDHRWHAVRGELLARQGRYDEAVDAVTESLTDAVNAPEEAYRRPQIDEWGRAARRGT